MSKYYFIYLPKIFAKWSIFPIFFYKYRILATKNPFLPNNYLIQYLNTQFLPKKNSKTKKKTICFKKPHFYQKYPVPNQLLLEYYRICKISYFFQENF